MTKRIAMISEHASPLAILGGVDSGGHVGAAGDQDHAPEQIEPPVHDAMLRVWPPSATRSICSRAGTARCCRKSRSG